MIWKGAVCVCICVNPYVMIRGLLLFRCLPTSTLCLYSRGAGRMGPGAEGALVRLLALFCE